MPAKELDELEELQSKFAGTYVGINTIRDGETTPFKVHDVTSSSKESGFTLIGNIYDRKMGWLPYTHVVDSNLKGIVIHPEYGMINHKDHVVYTSRVPARQWKEGLCNNVIQCVYPNRNLEDYFKSLYYTYMVDSFVNKFTWSNPLFIYDLYNPRYYCFDNALAHVLNGDLLEAAFSPMYCISPLPSANTILVFKKYFPVGEVRNGAVHMFSSAEFLKKELSLYCEVVDMENEDD